MKINMKRLSVIVLLFSFIIPTISFASIDANLKYGARGQEVTELQDFLISKGFLNGQTSGNFFSLTRNAVVSYQKSVGLPATGFVGLMTREKINSELSLANTPSTNAEITETGTTTIPTKNDTLNGLQNQINTLLAKLKVLNTQTTTQQQNTTLVSTIDNNSTSSSKNKTITLNNGAVVEIDALGNIVRTITSSPVTQQILPTQTAVSIPSSTSILPTTQQPTVDIKADGSDGPITVPQGSSVTISWTSQGSGLNCGIGGAVGWGGNWGTSGSKLAGPYTATTTVSIQCDALINNILVPKGISDSVTINVPVIPPAPFIATAEISPSSPLGIFDSQKVVHNGDYTTLNLLVLREPPKNINSHGNGGLYWNKLDFTVQSDDFSKSDIILYCSAPDGGNTFMNYDSPQCLTYHDIYFVLKNPHSGKLDIIVNSVSYVGLSDGIEYTVSNTPIDSGEITIQ
jgi:peptidoglycan hydrolase-like protein with peptidoglycan-binding domain